MGKYKDFLNGSPLRERLNFLGIAEAVATQKYHSNYDALNAEQKHEIHMAMVDAGLGN